MDREELKKNTRIDWRHVYPGGERAFIDALAMGADDTDWHVFRIEINAAASSVAFYIDGALEATHTTNIPSTASNYYAQWATTSFGGATFYIDYVAYSVDATRA